MPKPITLAIAFLILCGVCQIALAKDNNKTGLVIRAVAYRAIPHERTTYYRTQGYSNTTCFGSGTDWGYLTTLNMNCQTVTTPPQEIPVTIRSIDVFNAVQANGLTYTVTCTAHWVGSKCSWLIPGDNFEAEVSGTTMLVSARKGGNMGKEMRIKFKILDIR